MNISPTSIQRWSTYGMPLTKRNIPIWERINKLSFALTYLGNSKNKVLNHKIDPFSLVDYTRCKAADDFIKCNAMAYKRTGLCIRHLALLISGENVVDIFGNKITVPEQIIEKLEHYPQRCIAATKEGGRCGNPALTNDVLCVVHRYFLNGEHKIKVYTHDDVVKTLTLHQVDHIVASIQETILKL